MKNLTRAFSLFVSLTLTAYPAAAQPAAMTRIGAAGAVHGLVQAMAAGAPVGRVIQSGKPLFLNDHVTTDKNGRLQVMLLDETVFTIGPNSDMVLDEFVYDPATGAGKVTARVTKGVFRFVTGKVARKEPANMNVKLPVGTMGIRGTIAGGEVGENSATLVLFGPGSRNNANENPGAISVSNDQGSVDITRPGFGTVIQPGQAPSAPSDMSEVANRISGSIQAPSENKPSGGGGAQGGGGGESETAKSEEGGTAGGETSGETAATTDEAPVSDQAGETTAGATDTAADTSQTVEISQDLGTTTNTSSQDSSEAEGAITDGIAQWEQVRTVTTGVEFYEGSGSFACGGNCAGIGTMFFDLKIDFGARTIGGFGNGGSSSLYLSGPNFNDFTNINEQSFDSLTGDAAITLLKSNGSIDNSNFNGSKITLMNSGGKPAANATLELNYSGSNGETGSGSLTVPRGPPSPG